MDTRFVDRHDAGRRLATWLDGYAGRQDVLVLALPRGGVPVAVEVARHLRAPLPGSRRRPCVGQRNKR